MTKALIRSKRFVQRLAAFGGLLLWCLGSQAEHYAIPLFAPAGPSDAPQGVLRILNGADESGTVAIWAIDDAGARFGPATFTLGASAAAEFDASDLVSGNAAKGLSGGIGPLPGDLRLEIDTDLDIVPLAYARDADGALSAMHDTVPAAADARSSGKATGEANPYRYEVPVFNLASDVSQASRLRLINPGGAPATAIIEGRDDSGAAAPGGSVQLTLPAGAARTLTALQLEAGGEGLTGRLGAGTGRWRLTVSSDRPLQAVNIAADGTGWRWNNLSTVAAPGPASELARASGLRQAQRHTIPLFSPAGTLGTPQGLLRILNSADEAGTVEIWAIDDAGVRSGPATYTLGASAAAEFTAAELASGSLSKGLSGGIGPLAGDVRLEIESDLDIVALAYSRAADGALSALHDTVPAEVVGATDGEAEGGTVSYRYEVPVFNPASDVSQASRLRLANPGDAPAAVTVEARDDGGAAAPGGVARLTLPPGGARSLTALDLEAGGAGLTGRLGAGVGRWRLTVSSDRPLQAVNFATTSAGHIVNLSTAAAPAGFDLDSDNGRPEGVAWSGGRLHVVDAGDDKVFAYGADGARDAAVDFDLDGENGNPTGIVWSGASFHVVDESDDKVYTYGTDGVREASSDFDLDADNGRPEGIVWFGGRFYVVDRSADKAFSYRADGSREASSDFDLDGENGSPSGIAWADGRFWVTDSSDDKVYVYGADGSRDASSDFDLNADNGNPSGIAWADGPFHVADSSDDKAYGYSGPARPGGGDGQGTTYGPGDTISTLPTGIWTPDAASNASVRNVAGITNVIFSYGGYVEVGGYRYTCQNLELCLVLAGVVDLGTIVQTPATDTPPDAQPSFDLHFSVFDPRGIAHADGRYFVLDDLNEKVYAYGVDGQRDTSADFDLREGNNATHGVAHADGRFYVLVADLDELKWKVEAYGANGQREASADFDLSNPDYLDFYAMTYADGRFYVLGIDYNLLQWKVVAYGADGRREASVDLELSDFDESDFFGITYTDGRFYLLGIDYSSSSSQRKVYAYGADGRREASVDFDLDQDHDIPRGIVWADGRFLVVDGTDNKVYAYRADGHRDASADFYLGEERGSPWDIAHADGRLYILDPPNSMVYAYRADGQRDASTDFQLREDIRGAQGIEYADDRFYIIDNLDDKVYVYRADGQREASFDFDLHEDNQIPRGITYADGQFYVVDGRNRKVFAYSHAGEHDASADFDLNFDQRDSRHDPIGIAYADGRFYVIQRYGKVYAYRADGRRDESVEFELREENDVPRGIAHADGRFYVINWGEDAKVHSYTDPRESTYSAGETVSSLPTGTWVPNETSGARVTSGATGTRVELDNGGHFEVEGYRYTCRGSGGCEIDNRAVISGTIIRTPGVVAPPDTQPSFAAGSGPGDLNYSTGAVIDALTLPEASGGEGVLAYTLAPDVPGLSFDPAMRQLTGTPTAEGTYTMTYSATDSDGDTATLGFSIVVQAPDGAGAATDFDLDGANGRVEGLAWTGERVYAVDSRADKVFAYGADGQRAAAFDFELDRDNGSSTGIAWSGSSFHVVDGSDDKVYAYGADGQRQAASDFDLDGANGRAEGIVWSGERFYVVDRGADKVFAYGADGARDAASDFDLDGENGGPSGIAWSDGRFHVADSLDDKVYAYGADGQRDAASDFDLREDNGNAAGIVWADGAFFVADATGDRVHAYAESVGPGGGAAESFDLHVSVYLPRGITYADGQTFVVDGLNEKVYAYGADGRREPSVDFDLHEDNDVPAGIVWANGRFHIVDLDDSTVYAYGADGRRDPSADFYVAQGVEWITYAEGRFYVLVPDYEYETGWKVHAYRADGRRDASADFDLHADNGSPRGIVHADGRIHVVDGSGKVYAYAADGRRDPLADFELREENSAPSGVGYADGRFYIINRGENAKVYSYAGPEDSTYATGDSVSSLPTGSWVPSETSGARVTSGASGTGVELDNGGYFEVKGYRYTCQSSGGCKIGDRFVVSGTIHRTLGVVTPTETPLDTQPSFAAGSGPGDLTYMIGTAVNALTLPAASGGDGAITYALAPPVPGLTFDAVARRLTGTPSAVGTYTMTYMVTDADGDSDTISFTIAVTAAAAAVGPLDLHIATHSLRGITYANGRFYSVERAGGKGLVYAYRDGQRDMAADFELHEDNDWPVGIAYVNDRLYVVDEFGRVYAYKVDGQRDASAEFDLHRDNHGEWRIAYADGRFYVYDRRDHKVYAYRATGEHDASADFDLHQYIVGFHGIAYANGRFYVLDQRYNVYAYQADGQRDPSADFKIHPVWDGGAQGNDTSGITYADGRFYIGYQRSRKMTAYRADGQRDASADFDLHLNHGILRGIAYTENRLYVTNLWTGRVHAYRHDGQRDSSADFDLPEDNVHPFGIAYANGRLHVLGSNGKVYVYRSDGQRVASADFRLPDYGTRGGIAFGNGRFYFVDNNKKKVYAYSSSGRRYASADIDLGDDLVVILGIAYANGRLYVTAENSAPDGPERKMYAYRVDGRRDASADFDLHEDNKLSWEIAYGDNRFYVVDQHDSGWGKVYVYGDTGQPVANFGGGAPAVGADDTISGLATGDWARESMLSNAVGSGSDTLTDAASTANALSMASDAGTALSVDITRCSGQRPVAGTPGFLIEIEGTVRAGAPLSSVVVTGFGNGSLAGIDSLGSLAAGESRHFSITETIVSPRAALSCSVIAEYFDIGALVRGEPMRVERGGPLL